MKSILAATLLIVLASNPLAAQTIVVSDFDNAQFDVYSGSDWAPAAVLGPDYLTIGPNATGNTTAAFNRFFNPIPDLTGTTEFHLDLRLVAGNQVNQLGFVVSDFETAFQWEFTVLEAGLNTSNFVTLVFDLSSPDIVTGSGILDLDDIGQIGFVGGSVAETNLPFRMEFDNLVGVGPVPEPGTASLLCLVGLGFLARRRTKPANGELHS